MYARIFFSTFASAEQPVQVQGGTTRPLCLKKHNTNMTSFLKLVADDLYAKLGGNFERTTIIFPNQRASLFFNEYLWELAGGKTMWAPAYTTISELFASLADCTVADPILLVLRLWDVYSDKLKPTKSLDQLFSLIETMLSDFQDIDNNLVEPDKLFLNIADLKELTDFSFLSSEQRAAIEHFFGQFIDGGDSTLLKTRFTTMWNALPDIYASYHDLLLQTRGEGELPMVYEGMMKRRVVEALTGTDEALRQRTLARLTSQTYVMVGFNVLNKTELELFRCIRQERDAKFYWDYDIAYTTSSFSNSNITNSSIRSKYEAGQFIMENIRQLGNELAGRDIFSNLSKPKQITFIQSPTDTAQARYVGQWVSEHQSPDTPLRENAIVLCDENLLPSVLHGIDDVPAINVTMGYPITETPIYSLIQALLELQVHGHPQSGTWRYRQVSTVLKHPFIQKVAGEDANAKLRELTQGNVIFPTTERLSGSDTLRRIFTPVSGKALTAYLSDIIALVGHSYQDAFGSQDFDQQIYKECIFVAYTTINRLHTLQENEPLNLNDETLMRLTLQLLGQATIPFHGEPAIGLQVMGLLETRNLDFRHVIMLSVNEGQLPKSDKRASLIPYTLRAAYGMTTIEREVSLYAYYYYRLLQRAESITLLTSSATDGGKKGEMSRFMLQTLVEHDTLFSSTQHIELRAFTSPSETQQVEPIIVQKDANVMTRLHERFSDGHILSPSAINTYMKCPLKFYFNYVAGLRPDDEVSDDVDKPMFGTIFHDAMRHLYQPYEGRPFSSSEVRAIAADDATILRHLNNALAVNLFKYQPPETSETPDPQLSTLNSQLSTLNYPLPRLNGTQLINRYVIKEFILNQLNIDAAMAEQLENEGGYWQIISQEKEYTAPYRDMLLGGIIDRLDLLASPRGDRLRIVDYKTSLSPHSAKTLQDLFDPSKCAGNYHIMQTLYYCKVLSSNPIDTLTSHSVSIVPALMYCAKPDYKHPSGIVHLAPSKDSKKEEITDYVTQYAQEYDALLAETVDAIFTPYAEDNPHGTFTQCEDPKNCTYCDFANICRRQKKD